MSREQSPDQDLKTMESGPEEELVRQAHGEPVGIVSEFVGFLRDNKKWWLLPILLALLAVGLLAILAGTVAAPFIYPLF